MLLELLNFIFNLLLLISDNIDKFTCFKHLHHQFNKAKQVLFLKDPIMLCLRLTQYPLNLSNSESALRTNWKLILTSRMGKRVKTQRKPLCQSMTCKGSSAVNLQTTIQQCCFNQILLHKVVVR